MKNKPKYKKSTKEQDAQAQQFSIDLSIAFAIKTTLDDLGDLPRYPVLKLFVLLRKGQNNPAELFNIGNDTVQLNKYQLANTMESYDKIAHDYPNALANFTEKHFEKIGKSFRKVYLQAESDPTLNSCDKLKVGELFLQTFNTVSFYENEAPPPQLGDWHYISEQNNHYKEECKAIQSQVVANNKHKTNLQKNNSIKIEVFIDIFKDPSDAKKIIEILKTHSYIDKKGNWLGVSGNKTEPVSLIEILIEKEYTRIKKRATLLKAFINTYGLNISPRSINSGGTPDDIDTFDKIIPSRELL